MPAPIPFSDAFVERHPFGWLAAIHLPAELDADAEEAIARLPAAEAEFARALRRRRRVEFAGGRLALHRAAEAAGIELGAVLPGAGGGPALPAGIAASISHKRRVAAALVAAGSATLGLDVEEEAPPREAIASRVLRAEERAAIEALPEAARWGAIVRRFAAKEAIYKAIHPHVRRYVGFPEASVSLDPPAAALHLAGGEGPFRVELALDARGGLVLAAARISLPRDPAVGS